MGCVLLGFATNTCGGEDTFFFINRWIMSSRVSFTFLKKGQIYLEDMEGLKLDVGTLVSEEIHHELEILRLADVACHHGEVVSVQQQLAKKLRGEERRVSYLTLSARGQRSTTKKALIGFAP